MTYNEFLQLKVNDIVHRRIDENEIVYAFKITVVDAHGTRGQFYDPVMKDWSVAPPDYFGTRDYITLHAPDVIKKLSVPDPMTDDFIEERWKELAAAEICDLHKNNSPLTATWFLFPEGTFSFLVTDWFNEHHSKGVQYLFSLIEKPEEKEEALVGDVEDRKNPLALDVEDDDEGFSIDTGEDEDDIPIISNIPQVDLSTVQTKVTEQAVTNNAALTEPAKESQVDADAANIKDEPPKQAPQANASDESPWKKHPASQEPVRFSSELKDSVVSDSIWKDQPHASTESIWIPKGTPSKPEADEITDVSSHTVSEEDAEEIPMVSSGTVSAEGSDEIPTVSFETVPADASGEIPTVSSETVSAEDSEEMPVISSETASAEDSEGVPVVSSETITAEQSEAIPSDSSENTEASPVMEAVSDQPADEAAATSTDQPLQTDFAEDTPETGVPVIENRTDLSEQEAVSEEPEQTENQIEEDMNMNNQNVDLDAMKQAAAAIRDEYLRIADQIANLNADQFAAIQKHLSGQGVNDINAGLTAFVKTHQNLLSSIYATGIQITDDNGAAVVLSPAMLAQIREKMDVQAGKDIALATDAQELTDEGYLELYRQSVQQ